MTDVSGLPVAQAVARVYTPAVESHGPPQHRSTDTQPDRGLAFARGCILGLCAASVLWSCAAVFLSFTL